MNNRVKYTLVAFGVLTNFFVFGIEISRALEPPRVYRGVLILEGKIEPGDYFSVRNFLRKKSNFEKISGGVFLASPGGSVIEAMKIGHLIRALQLSTDAPSGPPTDVPKFGTSLITPRSLVNPQANYLCASSCFLVYVAGIYRHLTWVGRLGVHRPIRVERKSQRVDSEKAKFIDRSIRLALERYLDEMDVPEKYFKLMFSVPPNKVRWITQNEFDSDLKGYIPKIKKLINANCGPNYEGKTEITENTKCKIAIEQPMDAWQKLFVDR